MPPSLCSKPSQFGSPMSSPSGSRRLTAPGVTLIAGVDAATPVPVRLTVSGEGLALLVIVTLPAAAPVVVG